MLSIIWVGVGGGYGFRQLRTRFQAIIAAKAFGTVALSIILVARGVLTAGVSR